MEPEEVEEPEEVVEPEAVVRSIRRRRTQPPFPEAPPPVNARAWVIYGALTMGMVGLMFDGYLRDNPTKPPLPSLSQATEVRSAIAESSESSESLQVVVGWDLSLSDSAGAPDSVRVRVIPDRADTLMLTQPANQLADTAYLPEPPVGQAMRGYSCVAARHGTQPLEEICAPWKYVRARTDPPM